MSKLNFTRAVGLALVVIATGSALAGNRQKKPRESRSVREIRAVLDRQVECWNKRDLEGFMEGYWRSPELTFYSGGTKTSSWDKTIERYRRIKERISDQQLIDGAQKLIDELEADKAALHPERST